MKSAYQLAIRDRVQVPQVFNKGLWNSIWTANLHGRHQHFYWKLLAGTFPTLDRLSNLVQLPSDLCYLCGEERETLCHLLLRCPIAKLLWWGSKWQIKLDLFRDLAVQDWLSILLERNNPFTLPPEDHPQVIISRPWCLR